MTEDEKKNFCAESLERLASRIRLGEVRLVDFTFRRAAIEGESVNGWATFAPDPVAHVSISYETVKTDVTAG